VTPIEMPRGGGRRPSGASPWSILSGVLGVTENLHRADALKNVLAGLLDATVAVPFVAPRGLGDRCARQVPAPALRAAIVLVGAPANVSSVR
jgi:hypothetical protein